MFQLLQPIWLFSIAGIAIPLIIHLWNIRQGKTLQIGSISLLQESAKKHVRSLRLKNILLLISRCLLIITIAFLLAKPTWDKQLTVSNEKGWLLMEKESLQQTYKNYQPLIDSLLEAGYKFHYFNKGFERDQPDVPLKKPTNSKQENLVPYWALLKQLDEEVPPELPVYLFTDNKLKRFAATRPVVSMNLHWRTYTSGDTTKPRIVKAYETSTDSVRVVVANSKPGATFYTFENTSTFNNQPSTSDTIEVDTSTLHIAIYTDQFIADANYLKAAIDAIQEYTGLKIKVSMLNNTDHLRKGDDWVFWLSEKPVPATYLPSRIFVYEKGKEQSINSWITGRNDFPVNAEAIHISRLIENRRIDIPGVELLWKDGFGHSILTLEKTNGYTWRFYSRFNPDWNDLPWSTQFAEMIFDLLVKPPGDAKNWDNRIIDTGQLQPETVKENKAFNKQKFRETTDLHKVFWIIAFIIFCIERYISLTANKIRAYA